MHITQKITLKTILFFKNASTYLIVVMHFNIEENILIIKREIVWKLISA